MPVHVLVHRLQLVADTLVQQLDALLVVHGDPPILP
jgi:hypothetical protein